MKATPTPHAAGRRPSHPSYRPGSGAATPREPRYPYEGKIRLMVPFDPWRLLLSLQGVDLSISGVSAVLPLASRQTKHDAEALLVEGDPYDLQLEHAADHLPTPFLRARLARRQRTAAGLELAFAFEEPDADLLGLVHDLGQTRPR